MKLEAEFNRECEAMGLGLNDHDRELVFALWSENRSRRNALRAVEFGPEDLPFAPPSRGALPQRMPFSAPRHSGDPLHWSTAAELSGLLERGELSSRELTQACLDRIEAFNPSLFAFEHVDPDAALRDASLADEARCRGEHKPLLGIPVACKAFVSAAGMPFTAGAASRAQIIAESDAEVLSNLKNAGAIHLGQLRTHEFGAGMARLDEPRATGRNPWNPALIPGGSSSGSAVSVAAGMIPGAVGTDSAGSIRMPAANCNLVGLKPTLGLVPTDGVFPYSWSLDTVGILTRSVLDAALYLEGMLGPDGAGRYAHSFGSSTGTTTIGVPRKYFWEGDDIREDVRVCCEAALDALTASGAVLRDVEVDGIEWNDAIYTALISEVYSVHRDGIRAGKNYCGDWFRANTLAGGLLCAEDVNRAHRMRGRLAREFARIFREVDVLVLPGQAVPATPFADSFKKALTQPRSRFMRPFNVTGLPAVSVPCGFSSDGLPLAINLAAPAFGDKELLNIAWRFERETGHTRSRPDETAWELPASPETHGSTDS